MSLNSIFELFENENSVKYPFSALISQNDFDSKTEFFEENLVKKSEQFVKHSIPIPISFSSFNNLIKDESTFELSKIEID
jgi:hypothetical protein